MNKDQKEVPQQIKDIHTKLLKMTLGWFSMLVAYNILGSGIHGDDKVIMLSLTYVATGLLMLLALSSFIRVYTMTRNKELGEAK